MVERPEGQGDGEADAAEPDPGASGAKSGDKEVDRRFQREVADTKKFVHELKRGRIKPAEEALEALGDEMRAELFGRSSYVPVLVMTLLTVIAIPLVDNFLLGRAATLIMISTILILTLSRSGVRVRTFRRSLVAVLAATAAGLAGLIAAELGREPNRYVSAVVNAVFMVLILITLPALMRKVFLHPRITINTLAAAVSGYLLLGLFFAVTFRFMSEIGTEQFFAQMPNDQVGGSDYEYFSFITITTVGYGDLTPLSGLARAGAVSEAVIGQIFLVTIVARVVGQLGRERTQDPEVIARYEEHYRRKDLVQPSRGPDPDPPDGSDPSDPPDEPT